MKKMIAILFAVLILLLAGCSATPDTTQANTDGFANISFGHFYEVQDSEAGYHNYLEKYQKQIREDFVHLDDLPPLGSFTGFVPIPFEFPNQYKYSFCDDGERDIYLTITHLSDNSSGSASTSEYSLATVTDDMTSMMKKSASKTESVINRNGLEYYYSVKGELSRIAWCSDGIQYKINGQLHHRGVYNNSLFKRLISIDETEANAAFEEIKQALNSK